MVANEFARRLRKNPTEAERKLWQLLRHKRLAGFRFRRQQPIGPYVADFLCAPEKLIVELDGGQHFEASHMKHDEMRTRWLVTRGYRVIRFSDRDILKTPHTVTEAIWLALTTPPTASSGRGAPE
jgi:very-short-patch-repair endonuclease